MSFHEIRFPDDISRGARGGPRRKTRIITLDNGFEERNAVWKNSRREYNAAYGIRRNDDLAVVIAFFEARNGMLYGFRWKDWQDYKSCIPSGVPNFSDQQIGVGDGVAAEYQLVKTYVSGASSWVRSIGKPVTGTIMVALDGVEQLVGWSIVDSTGLVTFDLPPAGGVVITAGFQFDVPVRFNSDSLDVSLRVERLGSITSIPLVEVRR